MYPNHQMNANIAIPFFNNAQHHPERLALSVNQRDFSYGEFSAISERIAAWLRQRSAGKGKLVGILASRSWESYAGLLAACWAGATYLPLNPDWPEQRLLKILQSIELDALVVDERGLKILSGEVLDFLPETHPGARLCQFILAGNASCGRDRLGFRYAAPGGSSSLTRDAR